MGRQPIAAWASVTALITVPAAPVGEDEPLAGRDLVLGVTRTYPDRTLLEISISLAPLRRGILFPDGEGSLIRPAGIPPNHDRSGEIDFGRVKFCLLRPGSALRFFGGGHSLDGP